MSDDGFLKRWSTRKQASRAGEPMAEPLEAAPATRLATTDAPASENAEAQDVDAIVAKLPKIEDLGPGSDFSAFMQKGVPVELRRQALRRLWRANPVIGQVDGLLDYAEDFTNAATVVANMATTYKVGGYVFDKPKKEDETVAVEDETIVETDAGATVPPQSPNDENPEAQDESQDERAGIAAAQENPTKV